MSDREEAVTRESQICLALMRLGTRMASQFDTWFVEQGITQAQFRVLLAVWQLAGRDGNVTPSVLAEYLLIERPTATVLIARLVERGLLLRVDSETDRRSHGLRLTEAGGAMLQATGPLATQRGEYTLSPFDDAEQETLLALLSRLESHLRTGDFS